MQRSHHHSKKNSNTGTHGETGGIAVGLNDRAKDQRTGSEPREQDRSVHPHRDAAGRGSREIAKHDPNGDKGHRHEGSPYHEHDRRPDKTCEVAQHDLSR
jgi:hypothetical protein